MKVWKIKTKDGAFPALSGSVALSDASPEELRVLICLAEAGEGGADAAALAAAAGCSKPRARSALRYWEEVGAAVEGDALAEEETAKKRTPLRPSGEDRARGSAEIAAVAGEKDTAAFIDICEQTVGRVFNTHELAILTGILSDMPFSHDYILTLISYCMKKTKRFSFGYLEKTAHSMLERECLTTAELNAYLAAVEQFGQVEWKLRRLLGIGERQLGSRERTYFMRWTGEYGYAMDIIGIAYDITVNQTNKVSLPYMNKLLSAWHAAGCHTEAEVNAHLEAERAERARIPASTQNAGRTSRRGRDITLRTGQGEDDKSATRGSSFAGEDFMAAALSRSYGDDGT